MFTTENPSHCPKCMSNNIFLGDKIFKKDINGKDTNIVVLGMWFCNDCGNILGRKTSQYENDLDPESI